MFITFCKSKIAHGHVTRADLHYEGSITVAADLLKAVDIVPGEKVEILNLNNGSRIETYAIAGKIGSGQIFLNGPAARSGIVGDRVIILSYGLIDAQEVSRYQTKIIYLDEKNRIKRKGK